MTDYTELLKLDEAHLVARLTTDQQLSRNAMTEVLARTNRLGLAEVPIIVKDKAGNQMAIKTQDYLYSTAGTHQGAARALLNFVAMEADPENQDYVLTRDAVATMIDMRTIPPTSGR